MSTTQTPTPEQQQAHKQEATAAIENVLNLLAKQFDSKLLAQLLFWRACKMFRALHSIGMWHVKDVKDFTDGCMQDILVKLPEDKMPRQAILTPDGVMHPPASQRLS